MLGGAGCRPNASWWRCSTDPGRRQRAAAGGGLPGAVRPDGGAPAQQIADLYKRRWAIELFFRWIKQTLEITHFLGRSENAVRIQLATALIADLLIKLARDASKISPLAFARLLPANLMHRRAIDQLLKPAPDLSQDPRQLQLNLAPA